MATLFSSPRTISMIIFRRTTALKEVCFCDDIDRQIQPIHGFRESPKTTGDLQQRIPYLKPESEQARHALEDVLGAKLSKTS